MIRIRLAIVPVLLLGLLVACSKKSADNTQTQTQLTDAGSTFVYPMMSKWASEYQKFKPDLRINYQSIGSGGGIRQVSEGTVDFGATDGSSVPFFRTAEWITRRL